MVEDAAIKEEMGGGGEAKTQSKEQPKPSRKHSTKRPNQIAQRKPRL
jgi:hypothetical protein